MVNKAKWVLNTATVDKKTLFHGQNCVFKSDLMPSKLNFLLNNCDAAVEYEQNLWRMFLREIGVKVKGIVGKCFLKE